MMRSLECIWASRRDGPIKPILSSYSGEGLGRNSCVEVQKKTLLTGKRMIVGTWLRDICFCCCFHELPVSARVLPNRFCLPFSPPQYLISHWQSLHHFCQRLKRLLLSTIQCLTVQNTKSSVAIRDTGIS